MQTNTKPQSRFNFVDIIVILTLLAILAVFGYMLLLRDSPIPGNQSAEVTYTVKLSGINEKYLDCIVIGNTVRNSSDGSEIGTIQSVSSIKSRYVTTEGKVQIVEYPDIYDVYVTVVSPCSIDERNITYIGGMRILVGSPVNFAVTSFSHISYCTEFSRSALPEQAEGEN